MIKKQQISIFVFVFLIGFDTPLLAAASKEPVKVEQALGKRKKYKGYKKPKSKKFLGIFKRKSDCGCPNK